MNELQIYQDMCQKGYIHEVDTFYDSKSYFEMSFNTPLSWHPDAVFSKLNTFCPFFLEIMKTYEKPKVAEFYSGFGVFLKMVKNLIPESKIYFINKETSNSSKICKHILSTVTCNYAENVEKKELDIIFSDSILNILSDTEIKNIITLMYESLSVNGLLCLLINMDPITIRKDFDLRWIHDLYQKKGMLCVWGKYSFCSLWIKK
jgi:hypothetical protein